LRHFAALPRFLNRAKREAQYRPNLRSVSVGNYVVFFEPRNYGICVIRVLHGRRNIEALF
jgi:plasmid stabilization system protein ParE